MNRSGIMLRLRRLNLPKFAVSAYFVPAQVQAVTADTLAGLQLAEPEPGPGHHHGVVLQILTRSHRISTFVRHYLLEDWLMHRDMTTAKYFFKAPELQTTTLEFAQVGKKYFRHRIRHSVGAVPHGTVSPPGCFYFWKWKRNLKLLVVVSLCVEASPR